MAGDRNSLGAVAQRIYEHRIRPDFLDGVSASASPRATLIVGAYGSGVAYTMATLRRGLGSSVSISANALQDYGSQPSRAGEQSAPANEPGDVDRWYARLVAEATNKRCNLVVDVSGLKAASMAALAESLRRSSYDVTAAVVVTDRDQGRQAALAAYDLARGNGLTARSDRALLRDNAERELRESLQRLESTVAIDHLRLLAGYGSELYQNHRSDSGWEREPRALAVFDDIVQHRPSPDELADSALRWLTLAQRLAADPVVPRELASLARAWRDEAVRRAESEPQAQRRLTWGREAEAFRTLNRHQFLREFPQHAKAAQLLDEAVTYAEREFAQASERERFIEQTRQRVAERLAEGRLAPARQRAGPTR